MMKPSTHCGKGSVLPRSRAQSHIPHHQRYANRAKNIKNKPTINEDPKDAMLRSFQEQLEKLKAKLEGKRGGKKKRRKKPRTRIDADGNEVACTSDEEDEGEEDDGVTDEALEKAEYEKHQVFRVHYRFGML